MKIKLGVSPRAFYYYLVEEYNKYYGLNLTKSQSKVLAEIMYSYYTVKDLPEDTKEVVAMSRERRLKMLETLDMTQSAFNNMLSRLRKTTSPKGSPLIGNRVNENFMVYPDKEFKVILHFVINEKFSPNKQSDV